MLKWILDKLKCQRGEAGDLKSDALQDAVFTADIDDEGYVPTDPEEKPDEKADKKENDEPGDEKKEAAKKKEKAEVKEDPKPDDKVTSLEKKLEDAQKEINRLGYALRKDKKETKKDEKPAFTKTQLMQLWKENADNPEVAFQIMDEMTKLGKADAQVAAEKSADIKTKRNDMDQYLEKMYPDAKKEGTELYEGIQRAIEWAHLEGHPFADHLAFGLLAVKNLPETIKKIKEEAIKEASKTSEKDLAKKAEEARKKNIDASKPAGSKGKGDETKAVSLTANQMETLKRISGGTPTKAQIARYAKMVGAKGGLVHAEA